MKKLSHESWSVHESGKTTNSSEETVYTSEIKLLSVVKRIQPSEQMVDEENENHALTVEEIGASTGKVPAKDSEPVSTMESDKASNEDIIAQETKLISPVIRIDDTNEAVKQDEEGKLICPVARIDNASKDIAAKKQALLSVVQRINNPSMEEGKVKRPHNGAKRENDFIFTTASKNTEEIFVEQEDTYCMHNGKCVLLFDGILTIKKKVRKIDETFDQHGCVTGQEVSQLFQVELLLDGLVFADFISLVELYEGGFITKLSGGESSLESGLTVKKLYKKLIKKKIKERDYLTETMYSTPGWKQISGIGWVYVLPTGAIGYPQLNVYSDKLKVFGSTGKKYTGTSSARDFLAMRSVLPQKPEIGTLFQYYLMLSLMKGLLREMRIPPQFCLAIIGETNSKKTTLANLFFKLYDRDCGPDIDFTSTKVAIEESMARNADAVTIFDDITPPDSRTSERDMKSKLELLARSFGGNLSKKRSKNYVAANPGASEFTPVLSSGVITGEIFPIALQSSRTRIVKVEISRKDCDLPALTWHQRLDVLPAFVVDFLEYVTRNQDLILKDFWSTFQTKRMCTQGDLKTPRFAETYAMLHSTATVVFSGYLAEHGFDSEEIAATIEQDCELLKMIVLLNDQETNQRPDEVMQAECLVKAMHSANASEDALEKIHYKDNFVVVHPQYFLKITESYYERNGRVLSYTGNELSKFLYSKGLIKGKEENGTLRFTHKASFIKEATNVRFYYFYKTKIEILAEQGLI